MTAETTAAARPRSAADTRARILDAANEQFYANGIRATSADRIIDQVGITKVTFYRHFHTKSDLVVAYLKTQSDGEKSWMRSSRTVGDPELSLRTLAIGIGEAGCRPGFRGCPFINAAAEFPDPADPIRVAVAEHRGWMLDEFTDIAREAGIADAAGTARQLMILRDGAMVNGYLADAATLGDSLSAAFDAVLAAARS